MLQNWTILAKFVYFLNMVYIWKKLTHNNCVSIFFRYAVVPEILTTGCFSIQTWGKGHLPKVVHYREFMVHEDSWPRLPKSHTLVLITYFTTLYWGSQWTSTTEYHILCVIHPPLLRQKVTWKGIYICSICPPFTTGLLPVLGTRTTVGK